MPLHVCRLQGVSHFDARFHESFFTKELLGLSGFINVYAPVNKCFGTSIAIKVIRYDHAGPGDCLVHDRYMFCVL